VINEVMNKANLKQIFDAVGLPFLRRLLKTNGNKASLTPSSESHGYEGLALNIISTLCAHEEVAIQLVTFVPLLMIVIQYRSDHVLVSDALSTLLHIAHAVHISSSSSSSSSASTRKDVPLVSLIDIDSIKMIANRLSFWNDSTQTIAFQLIQFLLHQTASLTSTPPLVNAVLPGISR
jgi:hypothetical protein